MGRKRYIWHTFSNKVKKEIQMKSYDVVRRERACECDGVDGEELGCVERSESGNWEDLGKRGDF